MKCPFCNGEMQHGTLYGDARSGVHFEQEGKKLTWADKLCRVGALKVKTRVCTFLIEADYCETCKKMIFDTEIGK